MIDKKIEWVKIKELSNYEGKEVQIKGWLFNKRGKGKLYFLIVRDGYGLVQVVASQSELSENVFKEIEKAKQECSLILTGKVRKDERAPGGYEIALTDFQIVQNPEEDYPIAKKEHGIDFLLDKRHLWMRSRRTYNILKVRNEICQAIREFFYKKDFTLIDTPILTGAVGETTSTLFETNYFDWAKAYLAQTGQLYLEAAISGFGNVYCFGPTFRAEKSKTRRHLTEFWMVEGEMPFCDHNCNIAIQEELVEFIVQWAIEKANKYLIALDRDISKLEKIKRPFPRMDYSEAVEYLINHGSNIRWGMDLGGDDETILSNLYDKPVFIEKYPKEAKAFYMKVNPDDTRTVLCNDLLAPEGYGEIIGASQREEDIEELIKRIKEHNLPFDNYQWYLDLRKFGSVPHSGFGLGVERTVAWICGIDHVRETIPFPRTIYRLTP